jgi:ABC-type polysaccharide/polyol phosphate export permease
MMVLVDTIYSTTLPVDLYFLLLYSHLYLLLCFILNLVLCVIFVLYFIIVFVLHLVLTAYNYSVPSEA